MSPPISMTSNHPTTGPPSTSSRRSIFLTCFGYSEEKMQVLDHKVNSTSRRRRWLWSFSCKKSEVKSVNVDFKSVNETKHVPKHVQVTSEEQKTCRKSWTDVVKSQKTQNGSFQSRRKDTKPAAGLESAETKAVTITMKALTQSKSVPVVKRQKPTKPAAADGGVEKQVVQKTTAASGELDSIMGMLILLAIMIIMMLWGKVCAIFCTCAWFFIAPRVMAAGGATAEVKSPELVDNINMELESVEYKKKVVLEGLLQRNHRNVVVGRL